MNGVTRRGFLRSAGAVAVGAAVVETTEERSAAGVLLRGILKKAGSSSLRH